jgi:ABC-type multidrug transport system ATPase subunit
MQEVERLCDSVVVVAQGRTVATGSVDELLAATGQSDFEEAFVKLAFNTAGTSAAAPTSAISGTVVTVGAAGADPAEARP